MKLAFRDLRPEEIEIRVGSTTKDKSGNVVSFGLLLYKTARVDANVLDDTVGAMNWQKRYYQVKDTMVCSIGIYNEERKEWVYKDDGGDDDFQAEQVKAELSDSFKRAGFAWGIGRKLYSASKIFMRVNRTEENTEKAYYSVKEIEYDETSITKLVIINKKTKEEVITYGMSKNSFKGTKEPRKEETKVNTQSSGKLMTAEQLQEFVGFGFTLDQLIKKFNKPTTQITYEEMESILIKVRK